tara:strand:+ start:734 stop:961 length:228 start_codon:yes stop_codon:yes gene_type:complete
MANPWLQHVAKCKKAHPEWNYQKALTECRKTYTPVSGSKSARKSKASRKSKAKSRRSKKSKSRKSRKSRKSTRRR